MPNLSFNWIDTSYMAVKLPSQNARRSLQSLGANRKVARVKRRFPVNEFAERIGVSERTVMRFEKGDAGSDQWRLSPAFDFNPSLSRHCVLETGIIQGGSFEPSLELALEACEIFDINPEAAGQHAVDMARMISGNWKQHLCAQGTSGDDIRGYAEAFEHAEAEMALRLDG